ncbi:MAG TPA: hypothetical protein VFN10_15460 [Thermoanaerobaculia bacterium]|nr:hypothetical protein [Thermoanaerobaculia bacterium]
MGKYEEIVDSAWTDSELYAESVPHLLHQDLTYLWVLEKDVRQRPASWQARMEAWKYLISLFFIGELEPFAVTFNEQPLLEYTRAYGLDKVTFLRLPRNGDALRGSLPEVVGVLSTTVGVRPLPDFKQEWLPALRAIYEQKARPEDLGHFVEMAISQLTSRANEEYASRFANILRRELGGTTSSNPPSGAAVTLPLLRKLGWVQRSTTPPAEALRMVGAIALLVRTQEPVRRTYVPRCRECNWLLTRTQHEPAVAVTSNNFEIACTNAACGALNVIELERFLIWLRDANRAVMWEQESEFISTTMELPPRPKIIGSEVEFAWNVTFVVQGDPNRRFLRLQFPARTLTVEKLSATFFPKVLVIGSLDAFRGCPVRLEWSDAVDLTNVQIRALAEPPLIDIEGIRVHGWPIPIDRRPRRFSIVNEPSLSLGLYPDPAAVGAQWKWFRTFLDGIAQAPYRLNAAGGTMLTQTTSNSTAGVPAAISVTSASDPNLGVTYFPRPTTATRPSEQPKLAVDFGTTNTIVYYKASNHAINDDPEPRTHALYPAQTLQVVHWLGRGTAPASEVAVGGFLPPLNYREQATDRAIIPSALWKLQEDGHVIRWNAAAPAPGSALFRFKWDPEDMAARGFQAERKAYFLELLFLFLPVIARRTAPIASITLGLSFPLAFDRGQRDKFVSLHTDVRRQLRELTGVDIIDTCSINESAACIAAFGVFRPNETFLVADMGGGTMDVALFTFAAGDNAPNIHQIGSLKFAGEAFVSAMAQQQPSTDRAEHESIAAIHDAINEDRSHITFAEMNGTQPLLKRFTTYAFEFLRTMIAAVRTKEGMSATPIRLLLVGNGWHLVSAFSARRTRDGDDRVFSDAYRHLVNLLGEPNVELFTEGLAMSHESKHLVAIGALKNTTRLQRRELARDPEYGMMPAGRSLQLSTVNLQWSDLVGGGVDIPANLRNAENDIDFNLMTMAPLRDPWRQRLFESFGIASEEKIPYPAPERLREQIQHSILGEPPKLERGPLQLILENHWTRTLSGRGRS